MILITGATGMIGSLLADALVARDVEFTAMVRSDAARLEALPGVRVVRGDFDEPDSLAEALSGVRRAFLLTNSTERTEAQQLAFVRAAAEAGVAHVVKLSQLHARQDSPVRFLRYHAAVEAAIEEAGLGFTFIRPNLILQAYLPFAPMIAAGALQGPIGDARVSAVDARDIAAVSAAALTEDGHVGRRYDVTGPAAVTHAEIAAAFGRAIGRDVVFTSVGSGDFVAALTSQGMPLWQAEGLAEDYAHYDRGEAADVSGDVERVTGRAPRSLDDFAADYAAQLA
jgi:uncharacterized protein YbjT (DUF2867 family)